MRAITNLMQVLQYYGYEKKQTIGENHGIIAQGRNYKFTGWASSIVNLFVAISLSWL